MSNVPPLPHPPQPSGGAGCLLMFLVGLVGLAAMALVIAVAAVFFLPGLQQQLTGGGSEAGVGETLPRLRLVPLTSNGPSLTTADLRGKVTLIDFWGTWCPPCLKEFPHIAALEKQYRGRPDFQVLAVSCSSGLKEDLGDLRKETSAFLAEQRVDMPTYADPDNVTRLAYNEVGQFRGYPTTLLLDKEAVIRGAWVGYERGTDREIERGIEKLLARP
jgi:thiol-disulfide isomerase/thioredoxin